MGVVSRLAFKLPSVRALQEHSARMAGHCGELARQNDELVGQRDALESERDELAGHCRRLGLEIAEALAGERRVLAEREEVLKSRHALECERDELRGHCERLEKQLVEWTGNGARLEAELASLHQIHREFVEQATRFIGPGPLLEGMRQDWDDRARRNALHYTNTERPDWDEAEYRATGEQNVREYISTDLDNICQGADAATLRVVEIGCGAGRMTTALGRLFGEVHAVDISAEMIRIASERTAGAPNIFLYRNNGMDLAALPSQHFDFALSFIVFQHIASRSVIESYVREVHRILKPGRLFKFQVQGGSVQDASPLSTWLGAGYTRQEMAELGARLGFELRYAHGEGTQDFWLWFFKK